MLWNDICPIDIDTLRMPFPYFNGTMKRSRNRVAQPNVAIRECKHNLIVAPIHRGKISTDETKLWEAIDYLFNLTDDQAHFK